MRVTEDIAKLKAEKADAESQVLRYKLYVQLLAPPHTIKWLGRWTCDQQVAGSNPSFPAV